MRSALVWWTSETDAYGYGARLPWWIGYVRHQELRIQFAVVPLNLLLAWFWWARRGLRYQWTPAAQRWTENRAAIRRAEARGVRAGRNQMMAELQMVNNQHGFRVVSDK